MSALFATTLFLSACLVFLVQPIVAKMVLPLLGGAPAVWNTSMVFFQTMLLAGYGYAHLVGARWSLRRQVLCHLALLLVASLCLPIALRPWIIGILPTDSNPALWLLLALLVSTGLPFFALSANGPLLQRWFSRLPTMSARDPYFLYAASNLGSFVALLGYPVLLEPRLPLGEQSRFWTGAFLLLVGLILVCGIFSLARARCWHTSTRALGPSPEHGSHLSGPINLQAKDTAAARTSLRKQRALWIVLALTPVSLMLGGTTYLTTDIASIPLLWILPLSVYLLTLAMAFSRIGRPATVWATRLLPIAAIGLLYVLLSEATQPVWLIVPFHLLTLLLAAMACHGRLAASRPEPERLTEFYFWLSFGGMVGGFFNALVAPLLFARVTEYPVAVILACALATVSPNARLAVFPLRKACFGAVLVGTLTVSLVKLEPSCLTIPAQVRLGLMLGLPLLLCFLAVDHPWRFALCLAAFLAGTSVYAGPHGQPLHAERNFFGVVRVTGDPNGPFKRLVHGNTVHGRQSTETEHCCEPLSYYHRSGPVGQIMAAFRSCRSSKQIGVVGLGAGSMAAYASADEQWIFYEINPAVARVAKNPDYFTFLGSCAGSPPAIVLGDARLQLQKVAPGQFGLLVLDAFSSDAIPLHLITREALRLYLAKLRPDGMLAFHISNRYLDLENVLGNLAADAQLVCHAQDELDPSADERAQGKDASHWVVMARRKENLGRLAKDSRWLRIAPDKNPRIWTDDFSNVLSVFKWD